MKFKKLSEFEKRGLIVIIEENLYITVSDNITGTYSNNLIDLDCNYVEGHPKELTNLTGTGLTQTNEIVLRFSDKSDNKDRYFTIEYNDSLPLRNPLNKLTEIFH